MDREVLPFDHHFNTSLIERPAMLVEMARLGELSANQCPLLGGKAGSRETAPLGGSGEVVAEAKAPGVGRERGIDTA